MTYNTEGQVIVTPEMQDSFAEWFRGNYPGPDTIIHNPDWHAPRIFRAALGVIPKSAALSAMPPQEVSDELMELAKENEMLRLTIDILNSERNSGPLSHFCGVPIKEAISIILDAKATPIQGENE